jgi:hypothetical protein
VVYGFRHMRSETKAKFCNNMLKPVLLCVGAKVELSLKGMSTSLKNFERKVLRKIYGRQ